MKSHWQADRVGISSRVYSYFMFFYWSQYSSVLFNSASNASFFWCIFFPLLVYFSLPRLLPPLPASPSLTPANVLVYNRRQSSRSSQFIREHKNLIRRVLFLKGSNRKTMIRRCAVSRSVCVFLCVILVLCIHPCATLTIIGKRQWCFCSCACVALANCLKQLNSSWWNSAKVIIRYVLITD